MPRFVCHDPLLDISRLILTILLAVTAVAAIALAIAAPVALIAQNFDPTIIVDSGRRLPPTELFPAIALMLVCGAVFLALVSYFLLLMRRIVDTVAMGDPFIPENAQRLWRMAWLSIAAQVAAFPLVAMIWHVASLAEVTPKHVDVSQGGVLLALILFILARVFRKGTEMRDDLEGTV